MTQSRQVHRICNGNRMAYQRLTRCDAADVQRKIGEAHHTRPLAIVLTTPNYGADGGCQQRREYAIQGLMLVVTGGFLHEAE